VSPDEFLSYAGGTVLDELPEPVPGTLHNAESIDPKRPVCWAVREADLEACRAVGMQAVALIESPHDEFWAPLLEKPIAERIALWPKIYVVGGGREFMEELARRLGRHRVWLCAWPDGCHDAGETMQRKGAAALKACIDAAEPYPIEGIYKASPATMLAFAKQPPPATMTTGAGATDRIIHLPTEGRMIFITGVPSHGKSTYVRHVMAHTATEHGRRWAEFSPEMGEWQNLPAAMMQWRAGKPFRANRYMEGMTDAEIADGATWCEKHFASISADGEDDEPTVPWLMERAAACVLRFGTTDLVVDPWNEIAHDQGGMRDDQYVGTTLRRWRTWGRRYGCNVWIVVHPTKLKALKPGDPVPVPTPYDINQGAMWYNKADVILVVHRPEPERDGDAPVTTVHLAKSKFWRWGKSGDKADLSFDMTTGRFSSAMLADSVNEELRGRWGD
jgi:twinkle protein